MKRALSVALLCTTGLFAAKVVHVDERFQSSQNCRVCHKRIVDEWSHSWHAKSHFAKDEYFAKSMQYVSRKSRKSLNAIKVQCATCHNPRISVTSTDESYEIASVMGLNKNDVVSRALKDKALSEGINCVVCHNVDKIHDEYDASKRGINRVEWTASGTMTGPYKDAKSPYHKTKHHDFMDKTPNKLCFVCHANDRSVKGLVFTNMQQEYKGSQSCVSCHMGPRHRDVAATYKFNGKAKMREVRSHVFQGAHIASMWENALKLQLKKHKGKLLLSIINPQPHNIPSGFGARELLVEISYKKGMHTVKKETISLTSHYKRKRKKAAIPHLAITQSKDTSIPAQGKRVLKLANIEGVTNVQVTLYYRLVNDEVRKLLKLQDAIYAEKFFIASTRIKL